MVEKVLADAITQDAQALRLQLSRLRFDDEWSRGPSLMAVLSTRYVFLLRELVRRDFQGRYAGSMLGFFWSFAQPLLQLLLFSFVFSIILRVPATANPRGAGFAVTLFAGLLPWIAVQEGIMRSATAITDNASVVKKLRFPTEVLVLSVVLAALLHQAIATAVFVVMLLVSGAFAPGGLALLLLAVPLQVMLTLGLALLAAAAHVFVRDLGQVLGMIFMAWFYVTPIVYPVTLVPEPWRSWMQWNPLTPLVALYRQAFLGGQAILPAGTASLVVISVLLAWGGLRLFRWLKPFFADEV